MPAVTSRNQSQSLQRPRILVVDDEPELLELIEEMVGKHLPCQVISASNLAQARKALVGGPIEVLVADVHLPDGDGMSLLPDLQQQQPNAAAIVITGAPSVDGAISALRSGAVDFVPKPFSRQQIVDRVRNAIERSSQSVRREKQLDRLRLAVKRLNQSRKVISKKVDLLCNDLVSAYGELSRQLDDVRTQEGFRKYIADAKDLEQLLCHSMDWLLREIGYANVAVFLANDEGGFQLGAYMKYTVAGDAVVTDALKRVLVPMAVREAALRTSSRDLADRLSPQEVSHLTNQQILAVNCTYLGESLATLIFFRDERSPFTDGNLTLLKQISPLFAIELASIVRDSSSGDTLPSDGGDSALEDPDQKPKGRKPDPADWWKRGEPPPF